MLRLNSRLSSRRPLGWPRLQSLAGRSSSCRPAAAAAACQALPSLAAAGHQASKGGAPQLGDGVKHAPHIVHLRRMTNAMHTPSATGNTFIRRSTQRRARLTQHATFPNVGTARLQNLMQCPADPYMSDIRGPSSRPHEACTAAAAVWKHSPPAAPRTWGRPAPQMRSERGRGHGRGSSSLQGRVGCRGPEKTA